MEGHPNRPHLCSILLLLLVVVQLGQVSGRARIIRSTVVDNLKENDSTHAEEAVAADSNEPIRRDARGLSHEHGHDNSHGKDKGGIHSQFLCPSQYQGVSYQCLDHGVCQPHDVWQGAYCAGNPLLVCCRVGLGATVSGGVPGSGYIQRDPVDYYSLPQNLLTQLINPEAYDVINTYSRRMSCGEKTLVKSRKCLNKVRISSGNEDSETCFGEWPWHVAILEKQRHKCSKQTLSTYDRWRLRCHIVHPVDLYRYICGGSLISANHVITAAHCVKGVRQDRLKLHLGDYNLYSYTRELLPEIQRYVIEAHIHEGYDPYTYEDDLAILTLDKAVDFRLTPHIGPVCIPSVHHDFVENAHCTIVGWGEDPYKPNHESNILKSVHVTIGTEEECEDKLGQNYTLGKNQLCVVGNLGTDACLGDGGGAVVCPLKADADYGQHYLGSKDAPDQYFIAGIISWGTGSCGEDSVTIINLLAPYINWIGVKTLPPRHGYNEHRHYPYQSHQPHYQSHHTLHHDPHHQFHQHGTNACQLNPFFKRVESSGFEALTGHRMSMDDIRCVFGELFIQNPNYKVWYDSVFRAESGTDHAVDVDTDSQSAATESCKDNPFLKKVEDSGYGAITGMSLTLEDTTCVFGKNFIVNPSYKIWFESVHGQGNTATGSTTGNQGNVLTDNASQGVGPSPDASCKDNPFYSKVETSGYSAVTGMVMSLKDINCVFGEDFTKNPNYNNYFVSVYCIPRDGVQIPAVCCEAPNFSRAACCGEGKHNPAGLCV